MMADTVETTETTDATERPATDGHTAPHAVAFRILVVVLLGLLILTWLTVAASGREDLRQVAVWVALIIATVKASLVGLYFMHLRYESPFYATILVCALLFVAIFMSLALMDTGEYQPSVGEFRQANPAAFE